MIVFIVDAAGNCWIEPQPDMEDEIRAEQVRHFDTDECEQGILKSLLLEIQNELDPEIQRVRANTYYDMLIAVEYRRGMSK